MNAKTEGFGCRNRIVSASFMFLSLMLVLLSWMPAIAASAPLLELQKLVAADGAAGDYFGWSVAVSSDGSTALIGAPVKNVAYLFTKSGATWTQRQQLIAADSAAGDFFGNSVALNSDGSTALVGAQSKNSYTGAVYVFTNNGGTWSQHKLSASNAATGDYFGSSISLNSDGSTALIGAYAKNSGAGAAYVFAKNGATWTEQTLTAAAPSAGDNFGNSVSLSGDGSAALVGAYHKTVSGNTLQGAAYYFWKNGSTWEEKQILTGSDSVSGDYFGCSVALNSDGSTALVGAYKKNNFTGTAYVYTRSGTSWTEQKSLIPLNAVTGTNFSYSLSLSSDGNAALIGAHGTNQYAGAAYLFTRNATIWTQQQKLTSSDNVIGDNFGNSVSLSGDGATTLMGAYKKNSIMGAAYLFSGLRFCDDGYYDNRSACVPCLSGSYQTAGFNDVCLSCAPGLIQPLTGKSSCIRYCGAGQFDTGSGCTPCPAGSYQADLSFNPSCIAAPAGTFVATPGAAAPTPCPAGTFQSQTGTTSCTLCPAGTYQPSPGQTACFTIPKGVGSVVLDPQNLQHLYAGIDNAGVYFSLNGGTTWTAATTQPTNNRVKAVVLKPGDSAKQFAGTYGGGVFKSVDRGITWSACGTSGLGNLNVLSLSMDNAGKLYAGTEAGVFASSDGCASWAAKNSGLPS